MELYADGANFEQIATTLKGEMLTSKDPAVLRAAKGLSSTTVQRWYAASKQPAPDGQEKTGAMRDWDAFRAEVEENAARDVGRKLASKRAALALTHFEDLEQLRLLTRRSLTVPHERNPDIRVPRPDLSPHDVRAAADAYRKVQDGQRLIFGEKLYIVGVEAKAGAPSATAEDDGDLPPELVHGLEEALARAAADPHGFGLALTATSTTRSAAPAGDAGAGDEDGDG